MKKNICIAQIGIKENDIEENLKKIKRIIRENAGADLIVFPELVIDGHRCSASPHDEMGAMIARKPVKVCRELHAYVKSLETSVIFGEMEQIDDKIYNLAVFAHPERIEHYAKTHVHWSENFTAGNELKTFDSARLGRIGILICFDAAFPEAGRVLALKGAKTIVVISAIPESFDMEYMMVRLRAMAHNNQLFVLFANRSGKGFRGNSAVFTPRGEIAVRLGETEEVLRTTLDYAELEKWRLEEAIYPHRRPDLYNKILE